MRRLRSLMYLKQTLANASQTSMPPARSNDPSGYAQPWLDTARFSRRDMDIHDDPERVRKRSARKFMLGCSLAPTLDIPSGPECARTVLAVFTEVEAMPDGGEKEKAKMVRCCSVTSVGRCLHLTDFLIARSPFSVPAQLLQVVAT